jgi:hypothetical protein
VFIPTISCVRGRGRTLLQHSYRLHAWQEVQGSIRDGRQYVKLTRHIYERFCHDSFIRHFDFDSDSHSYWHLGLLPAYRLRYVKFIVKPKTVYRRLLECKCRNIRHSCSYKVGCTVCICKCDLREYLNYKFNSPPPPPCYSEQRVSYAVHGQMKLFTKLTLNQL